MEHYSAIFFVVKFVICSGLLYYTFKTKKENTLLKATIVSFIGLGVIVLANFILHQANIFPNETPFYEVNFTDFLGVTLIINAVFQKALSKS